jgi:hypothetical protein
VDASQDYRRRNEPIRLKRKSWRKIRILDIIYLILKGEG